VSTLLNVPDAMIAINSLCRRAAILSGLVFNFLVRQLLLFEDEPPSCVH